MQRGTCARFPQESALPPPSIGPLSPIAARWDEGSVSSHFLLRALAPGSNQPPLVCSLFSLFTKCFGAEVISERSQALVAVGGSRHS